MILFLQNTDSLLPQHAVSCSAPEPVPCLLRTPIALTLAITFNRPMKPFQVPKVLLLSTKVGELTSAHGERPAAAATESGAQQLRCF